MNPKGTTFVLLAVLSLTALSFFTGYQTGRSRRSAADRNHNEKMLGRAATLAVGAILLQRELLQVVPVPEATPEPLPQGSEL